MLPRGQNHSVASVSKGLRQPSKFIPPKDNTKKSRARCRTAWSTQPRWAQHLLGLARVPVGESCCLEVRRGHSEKSAAVNQTFAQHRCGAKRCQLHGTPRPFEAFYSRGWGLREANWERKSNPCDAIGETRRQFQDSHHFYHKTTQYKNILDNTVACLSLSGRTSPVQKQ